jgi:carboxyl-terminal processing protease
MKKQLLLFLIILSLLIPTYAFAVDQNDIETHPQTDIYLFLQVYQYIQEAYPLEIEDKTLIGSALKGMLESIDPYSDYYTVEEAEILYSDVNGTFYGVGLYIEKSGDYIKVIDTIEGGNAKKVGILPNDIIIFIDDESTKDMSVSDAASKIKGEKGTFVKLGIMREEVGGTIFFDIERDEVNVNPVSYKIINDNIGYIKLSEFNRNASYEVDQAMKALKSSGIEKLILDIRNNGGGLLDQAIKVSRLFVSNGPIVHIREKGKELYTYNSNKITNNFQLILLVNENSASASEILTGAIKDNKTGIIIGTKTFGKGIVQSLIPLMDGGLIKLTTAEYLTPNMTRIHGIGIEPDITITNTAEEDLQLKKAVEILSGK